MSKITENSKVFMVEFGDPTIDNYVPSQIKPVFVIAETFDKAGVKAYNHVVKQMEEKVVDKNDDNSLSNAESIKVRAVKLVSLNVII